MTEQDKNLIISLWNNGETVSNIIKMLPYDENTARNMIKELRDGNILKDRTKRNAKECVKIAVEQGIMNKYQIAEMYGYDITTIENAIISLRIKRQRPHKNYKKRKEVELSEQTHKIIEDLRAKEQTQGAIAKKYNVSRQYVSWLKKKYVEIQEW